MVYSSGPWSVWRMSLPSICDALCCVVLYAPCASYITCDVGNYRCTYFRGGGKEENESVNTLGVLEVALFNPKMC